MICVDITLKRYNATDRLALLDYKTSDILIETCNLQTVDTRWRSWLRYYATNRKVARSIPDCVTGIFHWQSFRPHYGSWVDSASKKMSSRDISWGRGGRSIWLTTLPPLCADCLEIWEPQPPGTLWVYDMPEHEFLYLYLLLYRRQVVNPIFRKLVIIGNFLMNLMFENRRKYTALKGIRLR